MNRSTNTQRAHERLKTPYGHEPPRFDPATLRSVPEPAARWLRRVVPEAAALDTLASLSMHGAIRLGRWLPFHARQILRAGSGFVWEPVVGKNVTRFVGADTFAAGDAKMDFRWLGLIPVARASGADVARSAVGRLAAETVAWLPQATTPQMGGRWKSVDRNRSVVTLTFEGTDVDVEVGFTADSRIHEIRLERWNNTAKPPTFDSFGGTIDQEFEAKTGIRVAGAGRIGWGFGTDDWGKGEFFRFELDGIDFGHPTRGHKDETPSSGLGSSTKAGS